MHFLNTEEFNADPTKRKFSPDGANKIRITDLPRDPHDPRYKTAGFITFRVEQCYKNLVASLVRRDSDEEVFLWLGFLSHYIGDSYQPFHSSIDYAGLQCPCNKKQRKPHNFHFDMEGLLFKNMQPGAAELREKYWRYFQTALSNIKIEPGRLDPYLVSQQALLSGYDYLPMLCRAGAASLDKGEFNADSWFNYQEKFGDREITVLQVKAERMAQAAVMLNALVRQAWQDAAAAHARQ